MDETLRNDLKALAQVLDAASTKIWQILENIPSKSNSTPTVDELNFSNLKYEPQVGAKLGEYEIAYKQSNLEDKWQSAYNILRVNNSTIKDRYHGEIYQYSYWLYDEDKIYRQKLKAKTPS
jgi:hypothetical protein